MTLKWFNTEAALVDNGAVQSGFVQTDVYDGPFPLVLDVFKADGTPGLRQEVELTYASIKKVTSDTDVYVTVILCRKTDSGFEWCIYCGDEQVAGTYREDGKTLARQLRDTGAANKLCNLLEASQWVAKVPNQATCNFAQRMARSGRYCGHTSHTLYTTAADHLSSMGRALDDLLAGVDDGSPEVLPDLLDEEDKVAYDNAFIQHVLLVGERGSGKTSLAREVADHYDAVYLEAQLHASTEAWELRAHDRSYNGKVYTVLGKLAEAVYWIQQGKRVVLCFDEILNMNPAYTTVVNTPLSLTKNDTYLIETGRIKDAGDGIGLPEVIEVPADKFWVIGTSNVGSRYGTDINPAVRARFKIILMNSNENRMAKILTKQLEKYEMPLEFATKFTTFMAAINSSVRENAMQEEATMRLATNVIRGVALKAKRDKKKYRNEREWTPVIKAELLQEIAQCVDFMRGPLEPTQKEMYESLVEGTFTA
ncbi:AAA family ATPase [Comamonas thiooxydans]|uniref:AAA family ATPase n=1 Tax=Comamonas thiooxydans TaxID=363952 RepID=UPI000B407097|nr:AAA family ATPase [Comamonas thiooxydans]